MAKLSKSVLGVLAVIVAATNENGGTGFSYLSADDKNVKALVEAGLAEQNSNMKDANGNLATRATAAGLSYGSPNAGTPATGDAGFGNASAPAAAPAKPTFNRVKVAMATVPPAPARGHRAGFGEAKYPFADLEAPDGTNYDSFFVPASDKMPNPAKALGSTISSAEKRFATENGTRTVTRAKRGPGRGAKAMTGDNGLPIMETVTLPAYTKTRQFELRAIEDGAAYGFPGVKGAAIYRTK